MLNERFHSTESEDPEIPTHGRPRRRKTSSSQSRSLLLNSSYEPLKILTWQKALILWLQDKVEILEYHNLFVHSVRHRFQLPAVLRLKSYTRVRKFTAIRFCRENVYLRDSHTCQYCGNVFHLKHLTLDHVVPASKNGPKNWTNVVTACRPCNQKKGNKTPHQAGMPLLREPRIPQWLPAHELVSGADFFPEAWRQYLQFHG